MKHTDSNYHPIDFDSLSRDQWVTAAEITAATGVAYHDNSAQYRAAAMRFSDTIEQELEARLGNGSVVAKLRLNRDTGEHCIYILSELDIPAYTANRTVSAFRNAARFHHKGLHAKVDQLGSEELRRHNSRIVVDAAMLLSAMSAQKKANKEVRAAEKRLAAGVARLPDVNVAGPSSQGDETPSDLPYIDRA
tara:strand:+ start:7051 stop:7626 length:576 start_codon:yes stop_codon:yes gene_type:complete